MFSIPKYKETYQAHDKPAAHVRKRILLAVPLSESLQKVICLEETGDLAGIIAKDKAAHGDQDGHDDRAPCQQRDGRVDQLHALFGERVGDMGDMVIVVAVVIVFMMLLMFLVDFVGVIVVVDVVGLRGGGGEFS